MHIFERLFVYAGSRSHTIVAVFTSTVLCAVSGYLQSSTRLTLGVVKPVPLKKLLAAV